MPTATPLTGPIDFSASDEKEVLQNVAVILATRIGSVPLDRTFGTDWSAVDQPRPLAAQRMKAAVVDAIDRHEPRAVVEQVTFTASSPDGRLVPRVTLSIDLDATS